MDETSTPSVAGLPDPTSRPAADVVVYDGACGFCRHQMQRLNQWDSRNQLAYVSSQDASLPQRWPDLEQERLSREICVVTQDGQRHYGAAAFKYLSTQLPRLWPLAVLMHIPFSMPIWHWLYRAFAKRRYRVSQKYACADDACKTHLQ
jgi:predicted DCC family thiol-disulfide oxidoreductase YuxK